MYEVKGEGQKGHLMLYIYKPFHNKTLLFIHYSSSPLLKTAAPSFSSISTSSPHHSRSLSLSLSISLSHCSLSISSPHARRLSRSRSFPLGLTSLSLSVVSLGWNSYHHRRPLPRRARHDLAGTLTEAGFG
ncbi:hypothetical protein Sjap_016252 [Stephania japonica]|uniref:Uncharacterized protein n=1 Tax=Stephania japonica TaxID=461633 RepID=A0AAP0IL80_9MAGN